ncbi:MAG: hypothetical protein AAF358_21115 [Pseudomonadota bacterium]
MVIGPIPIGGKAIPIRRFRLWCLQVIVLLAAGHFTGASRASVTDYGVDIYAWAAQAGDWQARAFEQDFALQPGNGCLSGVGTQVILLAGGGTIQVSLSDGSCPIRDGVALEDVADAYITDGDTLSLRFDPPIHAFYSYYGSVAAGALVTVTLVDSQGGMIDALEGPEDPSSASRIGHGFVSEVPIAELIFDSTEVGSTLLGAFYDLNTDQQPTFEDLGLRCAARPEYGGARCDFAFSYGLSPIEELSSGTARSSYRSAVALDSDTLLATEQSNQVDVFDRQGERWVVSPSPIVMPATGGLLIANQFGRALALDGNRALIGSNLSLTAEIFDRQPSGEFLRDENFQTPAALPQNNEYGTGVALRGDLAAVSAPLFTPPPGKGMPSSLVYIFERLATGEWDLVSRISIRLEELPVPGNSFDSGQPFAGQLAFTADDELLVSAFDRGFGGGLGTVQVIRNNGVAWRREQTLRATEPNSQVFGGRLAAEDGRVAIADPLGKRVYLFERDASGDWQPQQTLMPADEGRVDVFGLSLALDEQRLLIGSAADLGRVMSAIYVFERDAGGIWRQVAKIAPRDRGVGPPGLGFARSVAAGDGTVVSPGSPLGLYLFEDGAFEFPDLSAVFSDGFEE